MTAMFKRYFKSTWSLVATCAAIATVVLLASPATASAGDRKVYLNGIDLANVDVPSQSFAGCDVKFDAAGNVHITVKGLEMKTVDKDGSSTNRKDKTDGKTDGKTGKTDNETDGKDSVTAVRKSELGTAPGTYYLIAKPVTRKDYVAPYKVSVYINDKLVKLIQPDGGMVVMDVSKYVGPGKNTARLVAAREVSKASASSTTIDDALEIVIGKGEVKKDSVVIRSAYIEYSRNAAETRDFDDTFTFVVRAR